MIFTWALGISIPLNGQSAKILVSLNISGEDILVDPDNTPDSVMILSNTVSINTSLRKTENQIID